MTSTNKVNNANSEPNSERIINQYNNLLSEISSSFPKVDGGLLMEMLYYQTKYKDWEGSVMLKVVYPANLDLNYKKDWIFTKYQKIASILEDKTLRFKVMRMYIRDLEQLLNDDPEIEYITGSATLTPSDSYSS